MTKGKDKEAFKAWLRDAASDCGYGLPTRHKVWQASRASTIAEYNELLQEVRDSINYMLDDMKDRMDNDKRNEQVRKEYGNYLSCSGEKHDDGSYTFPMGQGALLRIQRAESQIGERISE